MPHFDAAFLIISKKHVPGFIGMTQVLNPEASLSDYTYKGIDLSSLSDKKIADLLVLGLDGAFAELYQRYSGDIYTYTLRLVSNPSVAEDLVQEIFVSVWKGLNKFKGNSTVKTWIYRIAYYQTMSWMRTYYKRKEISDENLPDLDKNPTPDNQSIINWRSDMVHTALKELSPKHRTVIEFFYFSGFSYQEISEVIDCPVGTVKSRMSYAIQNLNNILIANGWES